MVPPTRPIPFCWHLLTAVRSFYLAGVGVAGEAEVWGIDSRTKPAHRNAESCFAAVMADPRSVRVRSTRVLCKKILTHVPLAVFLTLRSLRVHLFRCEGDYFTFVVGDRTCGCKGSPGKLSVRQDTGARIYRIAVQIFRN